MDFKELFQKAEKNARKNERKIREADHELAERRRHRIEMAVAEREREKHNLKRKLVSLSTHQDQKPERMKQKRAAENENLPKKISVSGTIKKESIKQISAAPAPSSSNNIGNCKARGIGVPPVVSAGISQNQHKKRPNNTGIVTRQPQNQNKNFDSLINEAKRNDASAVEELFRIVESSSKKTTPIIPVKKPRMEEFGVTAGLQLSARSRIKNKDSEVLNRQDYAATVSQKQKNQQSSQKTNQSPHPSKSLRFEQNNKNTSLLVTTTPASDKSRGFTTQAEKSNLQNSVRREQNNGNYAKVDKGTTLIKKNMEKAKERELIAHKDSASKSKNVVPEKLEPQKRYLPGDIRFKGQLPAPTQQSKVKVVMPSADANSIKKVPKPLKSNADVATKGKISSSSVSVANSMQQSNKSKSSLQNKATTVKGNASSLPPMRRNNPGGIAGVGHNNSLSSHLQRKIEITPKQNRMESGGLKAKTGSIPVNRKPMSQGTSDYNLARIKREAQMRREMLLRERERERMASSNRKYANYSETDDDEEDDLAGNDDYDSDLADFIDDSMVDDLQREDLEETLKIINPRYNKQKWLLRERMIDDRRMDARFKDVELEERQSAKLGLVEDLMEAKRGSKALT